MAKLTKKALVEAYEELDEVIGVDPPIEHESMGVEEFGKELLQTVEELVEPEDEFSAKTKKVFKALEEMYGESDDDDDDDEDDDEEEEEEPAPKKGKAKGKKKPEPEPEPEEEDDDDDDEEEEEEEEEPAPKKKGKKEKAKGKKKPEPEPEEEDEDEEEEEEEPSLVSSLDDLTTVKELLAVVKNNKAEFKGFDAASVGKNVKKLKKAMVEFLSQNPGRKEDNRAAAKGAKKAAKESKAEKKASAPVKKKALGGTGVVATIAQLIIDSGKKGITKEDILKQLVKKFPDRAEKSMKNTVNLHVPGLMSKERFPVEKIEGTNYYRKGNK
jgi:hypothetical protein